MSAHAHCGGLHDRGHQRRDLRGCGMRVARGRGFRSTEPCARRRRHERGAGRRGRRCALRFRRLGVRGAMRRAQGAMRHDDPVRRGPGRAIVRRRRAEPVRPGLVFSGLRRQGVRRQRRVQRHLRRRCVQRRSALRRRDVRMRRSFVRWMLQRQSVLAGDDEFRVRRRRRSLCRVRYGAELRRWIVRHVRRRGSALLRRRPVHVAADLRRRHDR